MSCVIPDYDDEACPLPQTPVSDAASVHDAFLGVPGHFTRERDAEDEEDDVGHVAGGPHRIERGDRTLSYLKRSESLDYVHLSNRVPSLLQDQVLKITRLGEGGSNSLLAYAANIFSMYGAAPLVGIEGCLEYAAELDEVLTFTQGRYYHYCKHHMDVVIIRIIANKIEEKKPFVEYTKEGHANMTVHDGCGRAVNITVNGNGDALLHEMEARAKRKAVN